MKTIQLPQCQHEPSPYEGPSRDEVIALRHQYLNPGVLTYYKDPLMIVEGKCNMFGTSKAIGI